MSRGREAHAPHQIGLSGYLEILSRVFVRIGTLRIALLAAGVAFYGLLSFFPAVTAGIALLGLVIDPAQLVAQTEWLVDALPPDATEIVMNQLVSVTRSEGDTLGLAALLSLAIAMWSASNAVGGLMQSLNIIYEEPEERGFLHAKALTIVLTLAMIFGLALSLTVVAAIPTALSLFGTPQASLWAQILRWPLMLVIGIIGVAMLYRYAPDRRDAKRRWLTPGSVIACALWIAVTVGFSTYVQSFGTYNETFGALAGVIVLLTWMWLSAFSVLLGALLDAEIEAQTAPDSPVGRDRPMGNGGR